MPSYGRRPWKESWGIPTFRDWKKEEEPRKVPRKEWQMGQKENKKRHERGTPGFENRSIAGAVCSERGG